MATADSTPPPLSAQVHELFADAQAEYTTCRNDLRLQALATLEQSERERRAAKVSKRRGRDAILRELRKAQGIEERVCACGCGRVFVVEGDDGGRPRKYATLACRVKAWRRGKK